MSAEALGARGAAMTNRDDFRFRFAWERAMLACKWLMATTRLVLLTIATHANLKDDWTAYPSITTLMAETGLSNRALCEHIARAIRGGWITRSGKRGLGKAWKLSTYKLSIPEGGDARSLPLPPDGGDARSLPLPPDGGDARSLPSEMVVTVRADGGDSDDIVVVTQGHSNNRRRTKKTEHGSAASLPNSESPQKPRRAAPVSGKPDGSNEDRLAEEASRIIDNLCRLTGARFRGTKVVIERLREGYDAETLNAFAGMRVPQCRATRQVWLLQPHRLFGSRNALDKFTRDSTIREGHADDVR